ncbi:Co-chaperone protein HscB [Usitatibacter rugosus]|uniref:Co-chaperone protein HscB homolog n=1 Tax=Usitatibacter rugosus TaxID=2732067 RepID=A0A6M4GV69_9PROT|nr:Fe-S protein assembly co-chaperone HscB [Usitatibacter rugosus]QJR10233.1 Co-chaperone protein HscB [Usitatibacter rugosus]
MNEGANHFELMGLPVAFAIDAPKLERAYRELQSRVHPDKFAAGSGTDKRLAMQWATRANEAYRTLKDPVARARYMLSLKGFDTGEETNTSMPPDFLMEQMELREAAAEARAARDASALQGLHKTLAASRDDMIRQLGRALDADHNYDAGCSLVRKLRFLEKLDEELDEALELMHEEAR